MYTTHIAGEVAKSGEQLCSVCGEQLTSPGGTPWAEGNIIANSGNFWIDLENVAEPDFFDACYPCNETVN